MSRTPCDSYRSTLWAAVLAAGRGRRLSAVTGGVPKQFWSHDARPSLLESTLGRIAPLVWVERTVVVVDRAHAAFTHAPDRRWSTGQVLYQPQDRGTAVGVLFALTPVLEAAPDATVLISPSDHGVRDARLFRRVIREAETCVRDGVDVVILGAVATSPHGDYGWMVPGSMLDESRNPRLRRVEQFVEKPPADEAAKLFDEGGLWSTMLIVAKASALLGLYRTHLPELAELATEYLSVPAADREDFLAREYGALSQLDFSRDLLGHASALAVYTCPVALGWSDLGTPERFAEWTEHVRPRPRPAAITRTITYQRAGAVA